MRSCDAPRVSSPCQRLPAVRVRVALCLRGPDRKITELRDHLSALPHDQSVRFNEVDDTAEAAAA